MLGGEYRHRGRDRGRAGGRGRRHRDAGISEARERFAGHRRAADLGELPLPDQPHGIGLAGERLRRHVRMRHEQALPTLRPGDL
ncbi:hypothetical protein DF186_20900, partial [Enterococcus hirae]